MVVNVTKSRKLVNADELQDFFMNFGVGSNVRIYYMEQGIECNVEGELIDLCASKDYLVRNLSNGPHGIYILREGEEDPFFVRYDNFSSAEGLD
jgi:hypothetical protein